MLFVIKSLYNNFIMGCGRSNARGDAVSRRHIATYTEFFEELAKGRKLVMYEDLVLDLAQLMSTHPGGPEVLAPVIGRQPLGETGP